MAPEQSSKVYRLRYVPRYADRLDAAKILVGCIPGLQLEEIQISSLALAVDSQSSKTATVMFKSTPHILDREPSQNQWDFTVAGLPRSIVLDTHFYGLTPLNEVDESSHITDCVVISGLGSHPMGSWQPRGAKSFMWIRDELPDLLTGIRFIIYGYDTKLPQSKSFQTLSDLAISFIASLQAGDWVSKPLLFLAHSLGGVLMKQSIVALSGNQTEQEILDAMKGGIFFGVPSVGMAVEDIYGMLGEQPNTALLDCLSDRSDYVLKLEEEFERVSSSQCMRVIWAYETHETPSLSQSGESWGRSGTGVVMVPPSSATGGRIKSIILPLGPITSNDQGILQIDADHSNMVKFTRGHELIRTVAGKLKQILRGDIQLEGVYQQGESRATSNGAPKSTSAFRVRCEDLLSALIQINHVPADTPKAFDFEHEVSRFLVFSGAMIKMANQMSHQMFSTRSQLPVWINDVEDLQWLFEEMCSSPTAHGARLVSVLNSCTDSCSKTLNVIESTSVSTEKKFFGRPPNRDSLKQILGLSNDKEEVIRQCFEQLSRSRSILIVSLELLIADLSSENFRKLKDSLDLTSEESQCIGALRITDPTSDRDCITTDKGEIVKGTCRWILSTAQFRSWIEGFGVSRTLWISAPPGMGKTHLSIFLSKRLQRLCEVQKDSIALFFFCDNKVETRNTGSSILRGLIYQLIQYRKELVRIPLQQWKIQANVFSSANSFQSLWGIFEDIIEYLPDTKVYCLIDALDECEKESALLVLKNFSKLIEAKSTVKLIAVSRRHPEHIAESLSSAIPVEIDSDIAAKDDVKRYITDRVGNLARIKGISNKPLHRQIEDVFVTRAQDTFLWVSFMTHELLPKTVVQIEAALDQLPTGLYAVYDRILGQVDPEKAETISKLLAWVALAARPLAVSEICEALHIQSTPFVERDGVCMDYITACGHLLQVTQLEACAFWDIDCECDDGLFEEDGKQYQQQVTLVHQSVKDYLLNNQADIRMKFHVHDPRRMHEEIATRLMEEMRNGCVNACESYPEWSLSRRLAWPLGIYAVCHWDYHFLQASNYEAFAHLHEDFFSERSALRDKWYNCRNGDLEEDDQPSLLAVACEFGGEGPTRRLLQLRTEQFGSREVEAYVNQEFGTDLATALEVACIACKHDTEAVLTLLLEYGAYPTKRALTSYCWASDEPTTFARMLASRGARELLEARGDEILCEAAWYNRVSLCRVLIETYGVPVDARNELDQSALGSALQNGHMELANILVNKWRASTDDHLHLLNSVFSSYDHGTNLRNLHHIIKQWDININASHPVSGRGLVHQMLMAYLSEKDLKLLLHLGLDLSAQDLCGNTILHSMHSKYSSLDSVMVGMDVLRLLLQDERLNVDAVNDNGETALHLFISSSKSWYYYDTQTIASKKLWKMAKNLLDLGADRNLKNKKGKSPLDLAYEGVDSAWENYPSSGSTSPSLSSFSSGEDEKRMIYEYKLDVFNLLCAYATVPLFSPTSEKVEAETAGSHHRDESSTQTLRAGAKRFGKALHYVSSFLHDQRGRWFGRPRRRRVLVIRDSKATSRYTLR
ncbi:unnamed protein product [Clonostachys byssicola]|uniref:Nephrocystin 3-like N-terminal domain-containing protein n=1 Tax=Clonostachys byssicola TaxID=160290 RepID=A0A9N9U9C1_9HYPO|nr:unnamed protein product [Clonostachys byssicola]